MLLMDGKNVKYKENQSERDTSAELQQQLFLHQSNCIKTMQLYWLESKWNMQNYLCLLFHMQRVYENDQKIDNRGQATYKRLRGKTEGADRRTSLVGKKMSITIRLP